MSRKNVKKRGQKNPREAEACGEILPKEGGGDAGQFLMSRNQYRLKTSVRASKHKTEWDVALQKRWKASL